MYNYKIFILSGVFMLFMVFIFVGWNGEYVIRDVYEYSTERQCWIEDEWIDVDYYVIQWGTDWYRADGVKTFIQGKELQCSREYISTYMGTEEYYQLGVKDMLMFWKWDK